MPNLYGKPKLQFALNVALLVLIIYLLVDSPRNNSPRIKQTTRFRLQSRTVNDDDVAKSPAVSAVIDEGLESHLESQVDIAIDTELWGKRNEMDGANKLESHLESLVDIAIDAELSNKRREKNAKEEIRSEEGEEELSGRGRNYANKAKDRKSTVVVKTTKTVKVATKMPTTSKVKSKTHTGKELSVNKPVSKTKPLLELSEALGRKAKDKTIFLSTVDSAYIEMALNLYESSFLRHKITNFIFICMNKLGKDMLATHGIDCIQWCEDVDGDRKVVFNMAGFNRKAMVKTEVSRDILLMGYAVVVVDLDIVFLQNPWPYLKDDDYDLVIQNDGWSRQMNSGFYLVKPTPGGILMQNTSIEDKHKKLPNEPDQIILNMVVNELQNKSLLEVKVLGLDKFLPGYLYFSDQRMFATDVKCAGCVIVHNNYQVGIRQKIYKYREMLLWVVDTDGYYSDNKAKYISYNNPENATRTQEKAALDTALHLAKRLNRILILPRFTCPAKIAIKRKSKCNALKALDGKYFMSIPGTLYRENVFLSHPKVPTEIKKSLSPVVNIQRQSKVVGKNVINIPTDLVDQTSIADHIFQNLEKTLYSYSVIRFNSLVMSDS